MRINEVSEMVENTKENIKKLAQKVFDEWGMDTLRNFVVEKLEWEYENNKGTFEIDWLTYMEEI